MEEGGVVHHEDEKCVRLKVWVQFVIYVLQPEEYVTNLSENCYQYINTWRFCMMQT
jgi:hypothetical protein